MWNKFMMKLFARKDPKYAAEMSKRLSLVYGFVGWNMFCVMFYMIWKRDVPDDPAERRKLFLNLNKQGTTHVIRGKGFNVIEEYDIKEGETEPTSENKMEEENVETTVQGNTLV